MFCNLPITRVGRAGVLLAALLVLACGSSDDSAAIRKLIDQGAELAEKQQIGDLMRLGTEDFIATPGSHDANSVRGILFVTFRRHGQFSILYPKPIVEVNPDAATASATLYFMILSKDRAFPGLRDLYDDPLRWLDEARDKADPYLLQLTLVKKERRWQVQRAHIESAVRRLLSAPPATLPAAP